VLAEEVLGVMMQNGLVAMVFRKTLVLRNDAFLAMTSGKLTNLITTDAGKVRSVMDLGDGLIGAPLQLTVAMVSLHHFFGSALYIGLAYWLLFLPLTKPIMDTLERNNERVQKKTDARVQLVEETVAAVQIVKCNAWEDAVKERIHLARQQEMQAIFRLSRFEAAIMALVDSMIPVITLIIFAAYTLLYPDAPLTAAKAFTAVNLLEILRNAFFPLPMLIVNMIGLRVSMRRIKIFFSYLKCQCQVAVAGVQMQLRVCQQQRNSQPVQMLSLFWGPVSGGRCKSQMKMDKWRAQPNNV